MQGLPINADTVNKSIDVINKSTKGPYRERNYISQLEIVAKPS